MRISTHQFRLLILCIQVLVMAQDDSLLHLSCLQTRDASTSGITRRKEQIRLVREENCQNAGLWLLVAFTWTDYVTRSPTVGCLSSLASPSRRVSGSGSACHARLDSDHRSCIIMIAPPIVSFFSIFHPYSLQSSASASIWDQQLAGKVDVRPLTGPATLGREDNVTQSEGKEERITGGSGSLILTRMTPGEEAQIDSLHLGQRNVDQDDGRSWEER